MPLIDLQTNLKSFKYGHDRPGGGDSGQPFITTNIDTGAVSANVPNRSVLGLLGINSIPGVPNLSTILGRGRTGRVLSEFLGGDEFIRGGAIGAAQASLNDTLRIGLFLTSLPKGPIFVAKQVGLQLSNPKLETKKLSTNRSGIFGLIANVTNRITNAVGPTRIYNLGINTLAQVPVNAFGGHFNRHGVLPVQNENTKYLSVVQENNQNGNNRLLGYRNKLELGDVLEPRSTRLEVSRRFNLREERRANRQVNRTARGINRIVNAAQRAGARTQGFKFRRIDFKRQKLDTTTLTIDSYLGGPNSVYGVGRTIINRYDFTEEKGKIEEAIDNSRKFAGLTRDSSSAPTPIKVGQTTDFGLSALTSSIYTPIFQYDNQGNLTLFSGFDLSSSINPNVADLSNQWFSYSPSSFPKPVDYYQPLGVSVNYFITTQSIFSGSGINFNNPTQKPTFLDQTTYAGSAFDASGNLAITTYNVATNKFNPANFTPNNIPIANRSYTAYKKIIDSRRLTQQPINIVSSSASIPANQFNIFATDPNTGRTLSSRGYSTVANPGGKIAYKNTYNDVTTVKFSKWSDVSREERITSGRKDGINLTPIFDETNYFGKDKTIINGKNFNIRDLVRFRVQAVNTDKPGNGRWMVFRAYLTNLSDDTNGEWSDVQYSGRGEKLHIYTGFTRKINIGFKIATLSADEMKFVYNKLNYLMSNTMPDYKSNVMRGPLIRMSVGNWIDAQLGILNSISLKVPEDSPWEINLDGPEGGTSRLVLPHIVEVTLQFTPIGSESKGSNRLSQKSSSISNIAQNNTGNTSVQYVD